MNENEIVSICDRHGIAPMYRIHFFNLVNHGSVRLVKFGRLIRSNLKFIACLEEIKDVLSEQFIRHFEPTHFESMTQETVTA